MSYFHDEELFLTKNVRRNGKFTRSRIEIKDAEDAETRRRDPV